MKSAIYIEDGAVQFVLTPENEHERLFITSLKGKDYKLSVSETSFYATRANYIAQKMAPSLIFTALEDPHDIIGKCMGGECDTV